MADAQFLKRLHALEATYRPRKREITPVVLNELQFNLQEIGRLSRDLANNKAVIGCLDAVARRSLDMVEATSYPDLFLFIETLHKNKNAGYAGIGAIDAWANFRMSEWYDVPPFIGCMIRITDKFIRIQNLSKNPAADQVGESIKDSLLDLAIYCLIAECLWQEQIEAMQCEGGMFKWPLSQ